jgi:tRNA pseudouridine55 synthase
MLLVDKPAGITSHDVVSVARRALAERRIGHAGTLDPFATGLLVLLVGHATRLLPYVDGEPKVYDASIAFGSETDTDDVTGTVIRTAPPPDASRVHDAITALTGAIDQVPPSFSAKQVGGRRAYDAARRGSPMALAPVRVTVHGWTVRGLTGDRLDATITCAGGTYIRALARDLGRLCGSAAHLATLRRTRSGSFDVADAVSVERLRAGGVVPRQPLAALPQLPVTPVTDDDVGHVRQGRIIPARNDSPTRDATGDSSIGALVDGAGRLVAIAERVDTAWQPRVVLPDA